MNTNEWSKYLRIRLSLLLLFTTIGQITLTYTFKALNPLIILTIVLLSSFIFLNLLLGSISKSDTFKEINFQAVIHERKRLGREFHDGILQEINYLELKLKLLDKKIMDSTLDSKVQEEISELKNFAIELNSKGRDELFNLRNISSQDLNEFLTTYLFRFSKRYNIKYQLELPSNPIRIQPESMHNLFRIIQEVLINSQKHGQAQSLNLKLLMQNQSLHIEVQDDGIGFNPNSSKTTNCHGLAIIKERVREINGQIEMDSQLGVGTRIKLVVPL